MILAADTLGNAGDNFAVSDEALDQPVILAGTKLAIVDTDLAQVIVPAIADAAVVMYVGHGDIANITVDRPSGL